ncbi:MAG: hypothetical protein KDB14_13930 [Planctomycetales bacterium]|nr:hypothetical protein [Planctomycetales bacterium]
MVSAETLQTLHRIHIQISELRSRLERGPRVVAIAEKSVQTFTTAREQAKEELKRARMKSDEKQLQLRQREARVEDLRTKLNGCASNREFQTLKEQIAADEQANSVLEDEILESLDGIDQIVQQVAERDQQVNNAQRELEDVRNRVANERDGLQGELSRVEAELQQVEATLPGDFRAEYKRIANARGEESLAPVEGEFCGGCNQKLNPQMMNELMLSKPVFCKSCGVLLYVPEES